MPVAASDMLEKMRKKRRPARSNVHRGLLGVGEETTPVLAPLCTASARKPGELLPRRRLDPKRGTPSERRARFERDPTQ